MFIPAVLQNGFVIVGVQPFWQQVAVGAVLIVAVYLDQLRRARTAAVTNHTQEEEAMHVNARQTAARSPCSPLGARRLVVAACGGDDSTSGGGSSSSGGKKTTR